MIAFVALKLPDGSVSSTTSQQLRGAAALIGRSYLQPNATVDRPMAADPEPEQ